MATVPTMVLPTHLDLPDTDGIPMNNSAKFAQIMLLTSILEPVIDDIHPAKDYYIGEDAGIYYRITKPPLDGCKAPDWFYVPEVPHLVDGIPRRSYVLWQEIESPRILVEFPSGNGKEERDPTPRTGKFWVYERAIKGAYYVIYEDDPEQLEVYQLVSHRYRRMKPNKAGRYPIPELGIELGSWYGTYRGYELSWLRAYDAAGKLLPHAEERAEAERQRAAAAAQRADAERQRADALVAKFRELGIDPDAV